jgi:hypothetical protein
MVDTVRMRRRQEVWKPADKACGVSFAGRSFHIIAAVSGALGIVAASSGPAAHRADVVVSAGHEGRPASCARFPTHRCNLGTAGERAWSPIVADEAARILREHHLDVARLPADFAGHYDVDAAVFIHFDGSERPCSSGASIGYHAGKDKPAAAAWRALYSSVFPFSFHADNFTTNLRNYYAFRQVSARRGAVVLELGELTCPAQRAWLAQRLRFEGALIAHFLSALIGKGEVPMPTMTRR